MTNLEKYKQLLKKTIIEINVIDTEVVWSSVEPEWWLQMMDFQKAVQGKYLSDINKL